MPKPLHGRKRIDPPAIGRGMPVARLMDETFLAYNAARLREAAQLLARKILRTDATVGLSLTGAMTPAGLGMSSLVPLMEAGFVDWVISTGANLYHDIHHGLDLGMFVGNPYENDVTLRKQKIVRIYDVFFDYGVLLETDAFIYALMDSPPFQKEMGTAEMHYMLGRAVAERAKALGRSDRSVVAAAYRCGVPLYVPSPGDSSIGMNVAARRLRGMGPRIDVSLDVNETAAIVYEAKSNARQHAAWIIGGGSPKNFLLQTEPQLQEVLMIEESGHDYFVQITDARADTGGLSGATPGEAHTWGKVSEEGLPDMIVCYVDATVALPLLTAYLMETCEPRPKKRLYDKRGAMLKALETAARAAREH